MKTIIVEGIRFYPDYNKGAFYQIGTKGEIGSFYMPMNADNTPDTNNVSIVEVEA